MRIWDLLKTWRRPTRPKRIGLVLSGGAVRGAAHLGVLQVFNEHGIRPDLVVGASAGAVVGGLYCAGLSPLELQKIGKEMHWHRLGCLVRPGLGFFDISRMEEVINDLTGGVTIEELEIPFAAVAVDVLSGELIVLRQGSLARAIRASASLPGIFTPLENGDRLLIDGGALNNLPVCVAQDIAHTSYFDFGQLDLLAQKGREAAMERMGRIKGDLGIGEE